MNINELRWEEKFKLARKYYKKYGHLIMPSHFITSNGTTYNKNGIRLGEWVSRQKAIYNHSKDKMPIKHIKKLESIGMVWGEKIESENSPLAKKWNEMYQLAIKYKEHYQDSNIPIEFKTLNGIDFDEKGPNLYTWSMIQGKKIRHSIDKLTEEQIEALKSIQFKFPNSNASRTWEYNYSLAQSFYQENFHLNVPYEYMTPNEEKLGSWIDTQRNHQKELNSYQKEKLDNLSMIWSLHDNNHEINTLFELYGIKKFLNKNQLKQLKNYPAKEVEVKLSYLVKNGLPVIKDEKINEIFFMSNLNVEAKYGLRIKELVTKQYINKEK